MEISLNRGGSPYISFQEMCYARPALHTVFSTTSSESFNNASCSHEITNLESPPEKIEEVDFKIGEKYND